MTSSVKPSTNRSLSGSGLRLVNGMTATIGAGRRHDVSDPFATSAAAMRPMTAMPTADHAKTFARGRHRFGDAGDTVANGAAGVSAFALGQEALPRSSAPWPFAATTGAMNR
jgi:hypothetical protein